MYLFDGLCITSSKYQWQSNIEVSSNRTFDQFAIINAPRESGLNQQTTYYVNGSSYKEKNLEDGQDELEVPYYVKMPNDCTISHGRNSYIKNELYYYLNKHSQNEGLLSYCLRLNRKDPNNRVKQFNIQIKNFISKHDVWLQQKKNHKDN